MGSPPPPKEYACHSASAGYHTGTSCQKKKPRYHPALRSTDIFRHGHPSTPNGSISGPVWDHTIHHLRTRRRFVCASTGRVWVCHWVVEQRPMLGQCARLASHVRRRRTGRTTSAICSRRRVRRIVGAYGQPGGCRALAILNLLEYVSPCGSAEEWTERWSKKPTCALHNDPAHKRGVPSGHGARRDLPASGVLFM